MTAHDVAVLAAHRRWHTRRRSATCPLCPGGAARARSRMRGGSVRLRPREIARLRRLCARIDARDVHGLEQFMALVDLLTAFIKGLLGTEKL